jgi:flagellar hook protein FlgE
MRRLAATFTVAMTGLLTACGGGSGNVPVARLAAQEMPAAATSASTGRALDVAIQGDGQFLWLDDQGRTVYSREASLGLAADGGLVNRSGARLLGLAPGGGDGDTLQPLVLPERMAPKATSQLSLELNLDSRLPVTDLGMQPRIDTAHAGTYNNATAGTVFDLKGQPVALTFYFQRSAEGRWNVYITANGRMLGGTTNDPQPVTELQFTPDGTTVTPNRLALSVPASVNANGDATLPVALELSLSSLTQYGASFSVTGLSQDGYASGLLATLAVDAGGQLTALYSNGRSANRGRILLARFDGSERFTATGQGWLQVSGAAPYVTAPGLGLNGTLLSGVLEVDSQLHEITGS